MTFYKLKGLISGEYYYMRPETIDYYRYTDDGVMIIAKKMRMEVSKTDFTNMLILEGIDEYWHILLLTVSPLIQKIKLFY